MNFGVGGHRQSVTASIWCLHRYFLWQRLMYQWGSIQEDMEIGHTCGGESQTSRDSEKPHPIARLWGLWCLELVEMLRFLRRCWGEVAKRSCPGSFSPPHTPSLPLVLLALVGLLCDREQSQELWERSCLCSKCSGAFITFSRQASSSSSGCLLRVWLGQPVTPKRQHFYRWTPLSSFTSWRSCSWARGERFWHPSLRLFLKLVPSYLVICDLQTRNWGRPGYL